jgi:hypothetical protein
VNASELFHEAARRGLRLEARGDMLAVIPAGCVSADFANVLRQHKREILDWLEGLSAGLTPDSAPWLHVARQVLDGEFDGCDGSMRESLTIGLRSIRNSLCERALTRLYPPTNSEK